MLKMNDKTCKTVFKHQIDSALHNNNNEQSLIRLVRKGLRLHEIVVVE
jgi:hypothetical protein